MAWLMLILLLCVVVRSSHAFLPKLPKSSLQHRTALFVAVPPSTPSSYELIRDAETRLRTELKDALDVNNKKLDKLGEDILE
jgi:hypothetical protein